MNMRALSIGIVFSFGLTIFASGQQQPHRATAAQGWKFASESRGVKIFSRAHPGSIVKEFKAIGKIEASTREVHAVVDDVRGYPNFMPYTAECRLVKREGNSVLAYQRISPRIVCDRDYTLRIWETSWHSHDGLTFLNRWQTANKEGPPKKPGVLRVDLCRGSWLLEPSGKGTTTRATYTICSDSCGKVPAFLVNQFSQVGIRQIFAAIREQVKNPKYAIAEERDIRIGRGELPTD
jgi:Polyketide cyclase / dehydrase and lipid transport